MREDMYLLFSFHPFTLLLFFFGRVEKNSALAVAGFFLHG